VDHEIEDALFGDLCIVDLDFVGLGDSHRGRRNKTDHDQGQPQVCHYSLKFQHNRERAKIGVDRSRVQPKAKAACR
jgi:hypothetical protein